MESSRSSSPTGYVPRTAAPAFDPLVPRPIDRPSAVPLDPDADLSVLDDAKNLL